MTRTIWTATTTMTPDAIEATETGNDPICETCGGCGSTDGKVPTSSGYNYCHDCDGSGIIFDNGDEPETRNEASIRY